MLRPGDTQRERRDEQKKELKAKRIGGKKGAAQSRERERERNFEGTFGQALLGLCNFTPLL